MTVWAEDNTADDVFMSDLEVLVPVVGIPDAGAGIEAAGGEPAAVGAESDARDRL